MTVSADFRTREAAVLDVGSNSVRLVVYGLQGRAIWTGYNEKVLAGLGREVAATGKLSGEGVAEAVDTIRRFAVLMETLPLAERHIVATAAVREAIDGPGFCDRVVAETGAGQHGVATATVCSKKTVCPIGMCCAARCSGFASGLCCAPISL